MPELGYEVVSDITHCVFTMTKRGMNIGEITECRTTDYHHPADIRPTYLILTEEEYFFDVLLFALCIYKNSENDRNYK